MGNAINSNVTNLYSAPYASASGKPTYPDVDSETWVLTPPVKTTGAMGSTPAKLDTTTLADHNMTSINGLQDPSGASTTYSANYTPEDMQTWLTLANAGQKLWLLKIGEDGDSGMFRYAGEASVSFPEMAVNTVVSLNVDIAISSDIEWSKDGTVWNTMK